jgi:hypothetical protein
MGWGNNKTFFFWEVEMTWDSHIGECCGVEQSYHSLNKKSVGAAEEYFRGGMRRIFRAPANLEAQSYLIEKLTDYPCAAAVHMGGTVWFAFETIRFGLKGPPFPGYFAKALDRDSISNINSYFGMRLSRTSQHFSDNSEIVLSSHQQNLVHVVKSAGFERVMGSLNSSSGNYIHLYLKGNYQILR